MADSGVVIRVQSIAELQADALRAVRLGRPMTAVLVSPPFSLQREDGCPPAQRRLLEPAS